MDPVLRERVLVQSPWLADPRAWPRELERRLPPDFVERRVPGADRDPAGLARLIVGPRQAGKSTWVWSRLRARAPEEVLFLNGEEPLVQAWARSAAQVLADLERELPAVRVVFLDEAQHLEEAGLFVKGLVDARRGLELWVTGGSAFHLEARTRENLAGRAIRHRLLPLSLDEAAPASKVPAVRRTFRDEAFRRQLVFGGYPAVWKAAEPKVVLSDLVEAFVQRDASDRHRVAHAIAFRRLMQLAAGQVGQQVNLSEWAALLGIAASTVRDYLAILEESWIVSLVPPFSEGKRREVTSAARVHLYDTGLRNALCRTFDPSLETRPDRGALAEGWVFGELAKNVPLDATIHYWRAKGGAEMDLVVLRGQACVGVEVKAGDAGRPSRSACSFASAYRPNAIVVAAGRQQEVEEVALEGAPLYRVPLTEVARVVGERLGP